MKWILPACAAVSVFTLGCIGDDIIDDAVEARVTITSKPDSLGLGDTHQFTARYYNNIGLIEPAEFNWNSSAADVLVIDVNGLATGISKGQSTVSASLVVEDQTLLDQTVVFVTDTTVVGTPGQRTGTLQSTSSYTLEGSFIMEVDGDNLLLSFDETYRASTALPGLYIYLSNNPVTTNGAYEIGEVEVFNGAHAYVIPGDEVALDEYALVLYYCKPFSVKVGEGYFDN